MHRYAEYAQEMIEKLFPHYQNQLKMGRTSYRPAEIENRQTSVLKDDTRLHVDSFSSSPVHGERILRVFANINPYKKPRVWHVGESFEAVLNQFKSTLTPYSAIKSHLMNIVGLTKSKRSAYDHYMLQLHDHMKLNQKYQNEVDKITIHFPSDSTWIVFTDQVSHAALSGQFLLEQTFYLSVDAMKHQETSPLSRLQEIFPKQKLL